MLLCITRGYESIITLSNFSCLLLCRLGSVEVIEWVKFSSPGSILGCNFCLFVCCFFCKDRLYRSVFDMVFDLLRKQNFHSDSYEYSTAFSVITR